MALILPSPDFPIEEVVGAVRDALSGLLQGGSLETLDSEKTGHSLKLSLPFGLFYFDVMFGGVSRNRFGLRIQSGWFEVRNGALAVSKNNLKPLQIAAQEAIKAQLAKSSRR